MNSNDIKQAIVSGCYDFLGSLDYSKAGIMVIPEGSYGIIRVNTKYLSKVRAGMTLIDKIASQKAIVRTLGVSGMINKARQRYRKTGGK